MDAAVPVLECVDRWGRSIGLHEARWREHVLDRHAELSSHLTAVEATLVDPTVVTRDRRRDDRENFYRPNLLPPPLDHLYLKVVVEFAQDAPGLGVVITAYPVPQVPSKEVTLWP